MKTALLLLALFAVACGAEDDAVTPADVASANAPQDASLADLSAQVAQMQRMLAEQRALIGEQGIEIATLRKEVQRLADTVAMGRK